MVGLRAETEAIKLRKSKGPVDSGFLRAWLHLSL